MGHGAATLNEVASHCMQGKLKRLAFLSRLPMIHVFGSLDYVYVLWGTPTTGHTLYGAHTLQGTYTMGCTLYREHTLWGTHYRAHTLWGTYTTGHTCYREHTLRGTQIVVLPLILLSFVVKLSHS